jgi:hypothetical protein
MQTPRNLCQRLQGRDVCVKELEITTGERDSPDRSATLEHVTRATDDQKAALRKGIMLSRIENIMAVSKKALEIKIV